MAYKFVDFVRNYTATAGTGDFVLGPAVSGYTGFVEACQVGDRFYYSTIGIDRPEEREVGLGTLHPDGRISREPISGTKTNFTAGAKLIALIAPAELAHREKEPRMEQTSPHLRSAERRAAGENSSCNSRLRMLRLSAISRIAP